MTAHDEQHAAPRVPPATADAVVIGAGLSGLAAAAALQADGLRVVVLEQAAQPGGVCRTIAHAGYTLECGPHTATRGATAFWQFAAAVGHLEAARPARAKAARYVYGPLGLTALPHGPLGLLGFTPFSKRALLAALWREPSHGGPRPDDTVASFFARHLGQDLTDTVVDPFVSGVHAGDIRALELRSAFPRVYALAEARGSLVRGGLSAAADKVLPWRTARGAPDAPGEPGAAPAGLRAAIGSFAGGMGTLPAAAAAHLDRVDPTVFCETAVHGITRDGADIVVQHASGETRARAVVLALPAHAAAALLGPVCPEAARPLSAMPSAPMRLVHLGGTGESPAPPGFGALVPRKAGIDTLGALFVSDLFEDRAPDGHWLLTAFLGGATNPGALELDEQAAADRVCRDLTRVLGAPVEPEMAHVVTYPRAILQQNLGHHQKQTAVAGALEAQPGLFLAGTSTHGISVDAAVRAGQNAAARARHTHFDAPRGAL